MFEAPLVCDVWGDMISERWGGDETGDRGSCWDRGCGSHPHLKDGGLAQGDGREPVVGPDGLWAGSGGMGGSRWSGGVDKV